MNASCVRQRSLFFEDDTIAGLAVVYFAQVAALEKMSFRIEATTPNQCEFATYVSQKLLRTRRQPHNLDEASPRGAARAHQISTAEQATMFPGQADPEVRP
mgnify:CR=1 FL=1